jgi:hypothetical protein
MRFNVHRGKVIAVWLATAVLIAFSAVAYRLLERQYGYARTAERNQVYTGEFPSSIEHWQLVGTETSVPSGNSVTGTYRNKLNGDSVKLFIVCTGMVDEIMAHRPSTCYEGDGWVSEDSDDIEITTAFGRKIPCKIHQFYKSTGEYQRLVVLSFYVVNGRAVADEEIFSSGGIFKPGTRDTHYAAQVQIISGYESSVVQAASGMAEAVWSMLPGEDEKGEDATLEEALSRM